MSDADRVIELGLSLQGLLRTVRLAVDTVADREGDVDVMSIAAAVKEAERVAGALVDTVDPESQQPDRDRAAEYPDIDAIEHVGGELASVLKLAEHLSVLPGLGATERAVANALELKLEAAHSLHEAYAPRTRPI